MQTAQNADLKPTRRVFRPDHEWRRILTREQYEVLRQGATERPFGRTYEAFLRHGDGRYRCAGCGAELFSADARLDSHCGWPSFFDVTDNRNIELRPDHSHGMRRVEVRCASCGGHLGHVFAGEGYDTPTDLRYCINGVALTFEPAENG